MQKAFFPVVTLALLIALGLAGCGKSGSDDSASTGGGSAADGAGQGSAAEREARAAALAEVQKCWVKGPDGWTTARTAGSAYAPDHYLRQIRELTVDGVQSFDLTDSDRLNGIEWAGQVTFKAAPCREAGDPGIALEGLSNVNVNRRRGQWCQWLDFQPEPLRVQKVKGQWQAQHDTWLLRGALPTPADFANAGVK